MCYVFPWRQTGICDQPGGGSGPFLPNNGQWRGTDPSLDTIGVEHWYQQGEGAAVGRNVSQGIAAGISGEEA